MDWKFHMTDTQQQANVVKPVQVPAEIRAADRITGPLPGPAELVATDAVTLEAVHSDFAAFHESYVSRYIGLADTKASWAFAIAAGAITYMLGNDHIRAMIHTGWGPPLALFVSTAALLLASAVFSFLVIAPRLGSSTRDDIVYFGAVAQRKSAEEYVRAIASQSEAQLSEARLKHCYEISGICARKYEHLRKAILVGIPALFGLGALLFIS